ncbi:acyl carrier protein [Paenibacillus sp. FSL K6-1096]|uniref:acyl carrier protein n=1 Tax=Paenibacillus sp. FSL K6-1096 TaxID=2921460 RepID=UPI0030EF9B1F
MEKALVLEAVKEIYGQSLRDKFDPKAIDEDTDLVEAIGLNSIESIEILVRVEEKFGIEVSDEDLNVELVKYLSSITEYIEKKLND